MRKRVGNILVVTTTLDGIEGKKCIVQVKNEQPFIVKLTETGKFSAITTNSFKILETETVFVQKKLEDDPQDLPYGENNLYELIQKYQRKVDKLLTGLACMGVESTDRPHEMFLVSKEEVAA